MISDIQVLGVLVKPSYSSSASFECPITSDQIKVGLPVLRR
jgi:hypothetical protein